MSLMAFDDFSKQLFKQLYEDGITAEVKVGQFEKSFDILLNGFHPKISNSDLIPNEFKTYEMNIIEYKSFSDHYSVSDILKLIGDFGYYCAQKGLSIQQSLNSSCLWVIISNSSYFFNNKSEFGFISEPNKGGYYILENYRPIYRIIVLDELDAHDIANALLLHLASPQKFQDFLSAQVENDDLIRRLAKFIRRKLILEGRKVSETEDVKAVKKKVDYYANENIKEAIEDLGINRVMDAVGLNRVIAEVGLNRVIAEVGLNRVIAEVGLNRVIAEVGLNRVIAEVGIDALYNSLNPKQKEELMRKFEQSGESKQKKPAKKVSKTRGRK